MDEPDKEVDPFAWYDWKIQQLDQRLQELNSGSVQRSLLYLLPRLPARIIDELTTGYGLRVAIASIAFVLAASYLRPHRYSIAVGAEGAFSWRIDSATGRVAVCSPRVGCLALNEFHSESESKSGTAKAP